MSKPLDDYEDHRLAQTSSGNWILSNRFMLRKHGQNKIWTMFRMEKIEFIKHSNLAWTSIEGFISIWYLFRCLLNLSPNCRLWESPGNEKLTGIARKVHIVRIEIGKSVMYPNKFHDKYYLISHLKYVKSFKLNIPTLIP